MADDIVARLQCAYPSGEWPCESCTFCAARAEIERLRSAGDALAEALHGCCNGMDAFTDDWERLRVWQEARRG